VSVLSGHGDKPAVDEHEAPVNAVGDGPSGSEWVAGPVLAVDLGATFTKIVHRPAAAGEVWTSRRLALDDGYEGPGLVPTAIARRRADGEMAFGYRALGLDADAWESFPDWKRTVFVEGSEEELARLAPPLGAYLRWLATGAAEAAGGPFPHVAVTAPALAGERARRGREFLAELARQSFPGTAEIRIVDEASAAFLGAVAGHVNARALGRMLIKDQDGLWSALRDAALGRRRELTYRVLVADLGSLTLDLCVLRFDLGAEMPEDRLAACVERAESLLLGLADALDVRLHAALMQHGAGAPPPPRRSEPWTQVRNRLLEDLSDADRSARGIASQRADFRRAGVSDAWLAQSLFAAACETWPAPIVVDGASFGTREQWAEATAPASAHAERIAAAIRSVAPKPDYVLLTGGGFRATRLRRDVARRAAPPEGRGVHNADRLEQLYGEERRGMDLARFGTAFGAANVLARPFV
jgi:hypothetical protein